MSACPVQAVTFDVGGTLIQPWPSVGQVYAEVATRHGVAGASAAVLDHRFRACWASRKTSPDNRAAWEALVNEVFAGLCAEPPSSTFFSDLYERFALPQAWRMFDDVIPALTELQKAGVRIGIISNWDERLRGLLQRLKLAEYFPVMAISCEVGAAKPASAIFKFAASQFSVSPRAILHVGDDPERDVRGAAAAGFQSVQILRGEKTGSARTLRSLAELSTWIAEVEAKSD